MLFDTIEFYPYVNGQWLTESDGKIIEDTNPADGSFVAKVHGAGPQVMEAALQAAEAAFDNWANKTTAVQREVLLVKASEYLDSIKEDVVQLLIKESGSTWRKANGEITGCVGTIRCAAGQARRVEGKVITPTALNNFSVAVRRPLGTVLAISPFNYPVSLALKKVAYALAAGNCVVLKPASATPLAGMIIAKVFHEVGLPAGVLNVIPCSGDMMSSMIEDPRVKCVTFTGSSPVGVQIATECAKHLKKYTMELGGKNPMIILKDFDLDQAVHLAGYGAFFHQGQVCMATSRIIVEEPFYEAFLEKLVVRAQDFKVGDPADHDTLIGPLIDAKQCDFIDKQIADAVAKGARVLCGGKHNGAFYEPTIVADVTPDMDIFYEESFGPVTTVMAAKDSEEALKICNDNKFGLSSALLTNDMNKAFDMSLRMEIGKVHVNDTTFTSGTTAPSGGFKLSGVGKEGGEYSIEEMTELKWITFQYKPKKCPV